LSSSKSQEVLERTFQLELKELVIINLSSLPAAGIVSWLLSAYKGGITGPGPAISSGSIAILESASHMGQKPAITTSRTIF
jgi:hypothetical protein